MFNDKYGLTDAVLRGRKTQTRRIIKFTELDAKYAYEKNFPIDGRAAAALTNDYSRYKVGEVVAVAQKYEDIFDKSNCVNPYDWDDEMPKQSSGWTNKMFVKADLMPHRIRITDVRVERLQDISDEDCIKEGIKEKYEGQYYGHDIYTYSFRKEDFALNPRKPYAALIDKISGKGTWKSNPYVFVYDFELVK